MKLATDITIFLGIVTFSALVGMFLAWIYGGLA